MAFMTRALPARIRTRTPRGATSESEDTYFEKLGSTSRTRFLRHVLLCAVGAVMLYPLLWMLSSSFKPSDLVFSDLSLWPAEWDLSNYTTGWNALAHPFTVYILNSLVIVVLTIIGNLASCGLAAYAFARMEFRGRKVLFALMLGTLMLPGHVLLIPQYVVFNVLGWMNTYLPLVVPNFLATNAFFIFLMVQFMRNLPSELDDAARIDGCGPFGTFRRVIVPLCMPAFATTAIFTFISTWNEFFGPLLYLTDDALYTVPLALRQFMDSEGQSAWGPMFAMSVVSLAPVIGFFIAGQKYLIKGIATTGLK
ncbi:binding-protein-dependent transport systems inner membrane component [Beutenbergia cavernae DSM 12333]|uniref:Binding-protein-dependent transport systems inner membrane component n=1 Tax=Beutenbergia cavernae (strain ATCC BAA-8 / DSM 12333 / CCUG 43141 / JCM 11478 / NBRC 16432 / NCIMB 13614 / HKI 0122) TaxID=471853 RepID=C5BYU4_BEUC1|nr:carbohydrate ABC transporter permease [Beutenbergia cavernae]ACQ79052.1 binding-protein-dependent transport systems inner membrane component [Beutenbergia cavernae DSM 12333]